MKNAFLFEKKKALREEMLALRRALSAEFILKNSISVTERIQSTDVFRSARRMMAFLAMPGEVNVDGLIADALRMGKEVYVPVCLTDHVMEAGRLCSLSGVTVGKWGIRTAPKGYETIEPGKLDLIVVPGLACGEDGSRLGMGAGYYDRYLEKTVFEKRMAVVWDFQSGRVIPTEDTDRTVATVVTEKRIVTVQRS